MQSWMKRIGSLGKSRSVVIYLSPPACQSPFAERAGQPLPKAVGWSGLLDEAATRQEKHLKSVYNSIGVQFRAP
jgi:hypothetical protein